MTVDLNYLTRRTLAYMLDCMIVFSVIMLLLQWLILTPVRGYFGIDELWFHDSSNMYMYVLFTISLPIWLYFSWFDSYKSSGTIGKRLMKLRVLNQTQLTVIGLPKSFLRTLLKLLPWELAHIGVIFPVHMFYAENPDLRILLIIGLVLFIIYFFSIVTSKDSSSLYDKLLGVNVISLK